MIKINVVNKGHQQLPAYATPQSAGMDLRANIEEPVVLRPMERKLIGTGLHIALPEGYEVQIRPRSGLALKHGITVLNSPGTVDADYRADWGIILMNTGSKVFTVKQGDRIAQVVWVKIERAIWEEVDSLETSERDGGFGHSGVK